MGVDLDEVEDGIAEKIRKNLDKYGIEWEKLSEEKQERIVEGSKKVDRKVRQDFHEKLEKKIPVLEFRMQPTQHLVIKIKFG